MRENLRKSGISTIGDVPWGTHICQFYRTKEDLLDILIPYFKAGLENKEFCLWVISEPLEIEDAKEALRGSIPGIDTYLEKGQIEIIPYTDWFTTEGVFDSKKVFKVRVEKLNRALGSGYCGMRLSGNTSWLEKESWDSFIQFKEQTDKAMGSYQLINLCTYPLDKHNAAEIIDVVINHQFALIKREGKWRRMESAKRKQAEEAAVQATKNWEQTLDIVPDPIAVLDTDYKIVRVNRAMAVRLGMTPEDCVGLACYRVVHGTDEPPSFCPHSQLLKDGLEHTSEVHEGSLGGDFIVSVSPLHDSEGKLTGCIHVARDITKRKRAEEALRESEKRERARSDELAAVLDAVPVAVYIARDPQALQIMGNRLSYEWLRLPVGTNFSKSAPEGERPDTFKLFKNGVEIPPANMPSQMAAAGLEINDCELDIVSADGEIRHVLGSARPLRDEQGNLRGSISAFIDITERKEAEDALKQANDNLDKLVKERTAELEQAYKLLKESEKGLSEAQRMAHIGNWKWNIVTDEKYWSDEVYRIFGRSPQEFDMTYETFLSYVHPEDRGYLANATKEALKGNTFAIDYRIVLTGGEERTVHSQAEVIFDEENNPVQMLGTIQDITERKKSEHALELSEERYRSFIQNFKGIAFQLDKDLKLEFMKGDLKEITGYSEEEIIFKKPWREIILPEDLPFFIKEALKMKNSPSAYEGEIYYRIRSKDGRIKWLYEIYQKIPGKIGGADKYQGVIYDITEKKQTEETLAKVEIARKKEIHHRIKNNLQVISSLLDLQSEKFRNRECVKDEEVMKAFRESQDRVMSIALIHEELHEGKGTDKLNFSPYLERLVKNLFQTYRLGNTNTSLNIELEENIFFDMDIAVPLGIIINELVSNSLKYAFAGTDTGLIQIILCREKSTEYADRVPGNGVGTRKEGCNGTNFILTVSDNGIGIPQCFNSENSSSLGLQLVTILVDQLGGELELKRDSGTEFVITFTVAEKQ
jgi:PAS domain S-box-containing protein